MRRIEGGSQFLFAYFHTVLPYIINLIMLSLLSITKCVMTLQLDNLWTDKNLERHFVWMLDILYHEWLIILTLFLQITLGVFSYILLEAEYESICETWSLQCWNCSASRAKLAFDDIFVSYQQSISLYLSCKSIVNLKLHFLEMYFAIEVARTAVWQRTAGILKLTQNQIFSTSLTCATYPESGRSLFQFFLLTILQHPPRNCSYASQGIWIDYFLPTVNASNPSNTKSGVYLPRFNGHHQFCYDLWSTHTIWD